MNEKAFAERMAARKKAEAALIVDAVTRQLGGDPNRPHIGRPAVEFNHMADRVLYGCNLQPAYRAAQMAMSSNEPLSARVDRALSRIKAAP